MHQKEYILTNLKKYKGQTFFSSFLMITSGLLDAAGLALVVLAVFYVVFVHLIKKKQG